jgi:hypothetical protein
MPEPYSSHVASQFFVITPSAAKPITGPTQADGKPMGYCRGFITDTAGSIVVIGKDGPNTQVTLPVLAGVRYDFALRFLVSVSTSMVVVGFV